MLLPSSTSNILHVGGIRRPILTSVPLGKRQLLQLDLRTPLPTKEDPSCVPSQNPAGTGALKPNIHSGLVENKIHPSAEPGAGRTPGPGTRDA